MEPNCLKDKYNKKWIVEGYYIDENGGSWTLLYCFDDPIKRKKVKGII